MRVGLIFNPAAGRKRELDLDEIRALLEPHVELSVYETTREEDADRCAEKALQAGAEMLIAAGGDGSASLVASKLVGTQIPLALIPRGTSSSIAEALGIPADVPGACALVYEGSVRRIDTAFCAGRTMLLNAAIGLHADTIQGTSRESKNRWGVLAYIATGVKQLFDLESFLLELRIEKQSVMCRANALTIANIAPPKTVLAQGPALILPDDGFLDVTVVSADSLLEAVATGLHLWKSAQDQEPAHRENVGYVAAQKITVHADPPQRVTVDGEDAGMTPLLVECLPASLSMIVPKELNPSAAG
jgi:YegS/Rv2252/BmrU family lipid kinase